MHALHSEGIRDSEGAAVVYISRTSRAKRFLTMFNLHIEVRPNNRIWRGPTPCPEFRNRHGPGTNYYGRENWRVVQLNCNLPHEDDSHQLLVLVQMPILEADAHNRKGTSNPADEKGKVLCLAEKNSGHLCC